MATLTKVGVREALQEKGVPMPPGSPEETLVRRYREHFPGSDTTRGGPLDFSSDEEADTKSHDTSLPVEVSQAVHSLTNDQLYTKLKELGDSVGPIVDTTRSIYEKRLQRYLDKGATPRPLASPMNNNTAEFSATEEEAENDNEDDYEGTPLQDVPPSRLGLDASGSHLSYGSSYGGVFGSSDIMEGPLTSRTSTSFTGASPPLQMSLRNRAKLATPRNEASSSGNHVKAKAGHQQQQQRKGFSLLLKLALVVAFVGITVLIYANLEYFKFDVPVPIVVKARPK
ncbi:lamina-associated polypeptide 2 [Rhipicephalus microplus]|uniref:lamina-associated polypeptide 2 n=1 Tax=Rhipicephalus microplus TaxID=6941 RepID=UPI003F6D5D4C